MLKGPTTLIDQMAYSSFLALIPRTTFKNEDIVSSFAVYITSYSSMKRTTFFSHSLIENKSANSLPELISLICWRVVLARYLPNDDQNFSSPLFIVINSKVILFQRKKEI